MTDFWDNIKNLISKTKDLQYIGIANVATKAIAGIFWFYIAILLGSENYGQVSYFIAIGTMAASLALIGSTNTITVYAAKKIPIQPAIYVITLILGTIASIVVILIVVFSKQNISLILKKFIHVNSIISSLKVIII